MSMVYCRGCGKEIHDSAINCPHCGAVQDTAATANQKITTYGQVPWYRTNAFAIVSFFLFPFALFIILVSGDIYYERDSKLQTYSVPAKIFLIMWSFLYTVTLLTRVG